MTIARDLAEVIGNEELPVFESCGPSGRLPQKEHDGGDVRELIAAVELHHDVVEVEVDGGADSSRRASSRCRWRRRP